MKAFNPGRARRPQADRLVNVVADLAPISDPVYVAIMDILAVVPASRWAFAWVSPDDDIQDVLTSGASGEERKTLRQEFKRQRSTSKKGPRIAAAFGLIDEFESGVTLLFADSKKTFGILMLLRTVTLGSFTSSEVSMLTLALFTMSDQLSALRIDPDDGRSKKNAGMRRLPSAEEQDDSAYYVLDKEFAIVLAWNPHEQRRIGSAGMRPRIADRLPVPLENAVRDLTAAWRIEPYTRVAGTARPVPFLVVHTHPMSGPTGLFVGVRIDRSRAPNSLSGAALKYSITHRELQVLTLLLDGADLAEIKDRLNITSSTVQDHVRNMVVKTDSRNRTELVARVLGWHAAGRADESFE